VRGVAPLPGCFAGWRIRLYGVSTAVKATLEKVGLLDDCLPDHKENPSTRRGKYVAVRACEELIEGRWEPSCSEMRCDGVFYEPLRVLERFWFVPEQSHAAN